MLGVLVVEMVSFEPEQQNQGEHHALEVVEQEESLS